MRIPVGWFSVMAQTSQVHKNKTGQAGEIQNIEQHQL